MKRIIVYIFLWNVLSVSILNARPSDHIHDLFGHCYLNLEAEEKDSAWKLKEILDGFNFPEDVLHDFYIQLQKNFPETLDVEELLGFMSELPGKAKGIFVQNPELLDIYKKFKDTDALLLNDFKEVLSKKLFDAPDEFFENFKDVFTNKLGDGTIEVKEGIEKFISDLKNDSGEKFTKFIKENGSGVKAWDKLSSLTGTREWTRRSIPLLEKMSNKTDNFMDKVRQYYSSHTKPNGTGTPPFTHQGIDFDDLGHPDFFNSTAFPGQQYSLKTDDLVGHPTGGLPTDLKPDFNVANQNLLTNGKEINVLHSSGSPILIKIDGNWEGPFTWHHHQDGKTMLPVKQDIHNSMSHTGGDSAIKKGIKGFFTSPF